MRESIKEHAQSFRNLPQDGFKHTVKLGIQKMTITSSHQLYSDLTKYISRISSLISVSNICWKGDFVEKVEFCISGQFKRYQPKRFSKPYYYRLYQHLQLFLKGTWMCRVEGCPTYRSLTTQPLCHKWNGCTRRALLYHVTQILTTHKSKCDKRWRISIDKPTLKFLTLPHYETNMTSTRKF